MKQGTLIRGIGSFYTVREEQGTEYTLRCKKKFRREKKTPLVGDEVLFTPGTGEEHGWIECILERKNEFIRPPVSNITQLVLVLAPVLPVLVQPVRLVVPLVLVLLALLVVPLLAVVSKRP